MPSAAAALFPDSQVPPFLSPVPSFPHNRSTPTPSFNANAWFAVSSSRSLFPVSRYALKLSGLSLHELDKGCCHIWAPRFEVARRLQSPSILETLALITMRHHVQVHDNANPYARMAGGATTSRYPSPRSPTLTPYRLINTALSSDDVDPGEH